jgi:hypothetical protein
MPGATGIRQLPLRAENDPLCDELIDTLLTENHMTLRTLKRAKRAD